MSLPLTTNHRLPTELLAQIFHEVRDAYTKNEEGVRRMRWLRLAEVCRRWAAVVKATPALWTILHFYEDADADVIETFLARSARLPGLEVSFDFGCSVPLPSWSDTVLASPHMQRIAALTLRWHRVQNQEVYELIEGFQAGSLTDLTLVEDDRELRWMEVPPESVAVSETEESTLAEETTTEETTTDDDEPEGYDGDYGGQIVTGIVFPTHREWDSQSKEGDTKFGVNWVENDCDAEYDGGEESANEDEGGDSEVISDDEHSIARYDSDYGQPNIPNTDLDEEEDRDAREDQEDASGEGEQQVMGALQDGLAEEQAILTDHEEDSDSFEPKDLLLPNLPSLRTLSLSGLLLADILPETKATLRSLEVLDTGKYFISDALLDVLHGCSNLEELTLDDICLPDSIPDDRQVSLPNLRKFVFKDGQNITRDFLQYLELGSQCTFLQLEGQLDPLAWSDHLDSEGQYSQEGQEIVFKDTLPPLAKLPPATRSTFEAILRPTALTFRADDGFFVTGSSQDVTGNYEIDWQVGAEDRIDQRDSPSPRTVLYRSFPAALKELSVQAMWRTDTVTSLELHIKPCFEFIHALQLPAVCRLMNVVDAFQSLRRFVIGGEYAMRTYIAGLRSIGRDWRGLEELGFCLLPSAVPWCFGDLAVLMHLLGSTAELPGRLVVRLPPQDDLCAVHHVLSRLFPGLNVSVIEQECATCQWLPH
ncbi:hypothetical protein L226DRAFT_594047 [Lentinus tigrinus ALCF2SS1-7]|uniref:F-box domain-containing protein n=1 Tax=Lentinus tigrinus ALCF2SS1-6 TaxID=1328759 RepID=A0A5C2SRB7_9APHY|nr:hypothetical protein L227DRAFT_607149 [Lentinus tigrinus ALCF2SS1-6]RPD78917.1 hypothetical protein L226DRAFT_594047 [Lentinus tigrinus ALCF2SS1-7]